MPPSREFHIEINEAELVSITEELGLKRPVQIHVLNRPSGRLHGEWLAAQRLITLETGLDFFQYDRLLHVKHEIVETLLHELRHAHQDDTWARARLADAHIPYALRETEIDATRWAKGNTTKHANLIRIRAKGTRSVLSRISSAEKGVLRR